jgi:hypothetical protein
VTTTRRLLALLVLSVVTVLGASSTAANATFSDSAALPAMTVGTGTVPPATDVKVEITCLTTTTVIERSYMTASWGTTLIRHSKSTSTATSDRNIESNVTTRTDGPGVSYFSTTQVIQDTELYAMLKWRSSTPTRVSGYRMTAHTSHGSIAMGETGPAATQMRGRYDASVVRHRPRLSIDTLTDYGWTGTSALSNIVTC